MNREDIFEQLAMLKAIGGAERSYTWNFVDDVECGWVESVWTYLEKSLIKIAAKNFHNLTVNWIELD